MADRPSDKALADFKTEAQETIETLDKGLVLLEDTRNGTEADPDCLNAVFRAAHTLKGLSSMFGVERMVALAHALEDRLDDVRMGRSPLDDPSFALLQSTPGLFGRLLAEEGGEKSPSISAEVEALAAKLRGGRAKPPATAVDPIADLALGEGVRSVLTEYEEHRLRTSLQKGLSIFRVGVGFDLATFDTALDELKKRLKPGGEVIATLPSAQATDPNGIAFDVLFASAEDMQEVRALSGPSAEVDLIRRRSEGPPTAQAVSQAPPAAKAFVASTPRPAAVSEPPPGMRPARPESDDEEAAPPTPERTLPTPHGAGPAVDASLRSATQAVRVDIGKLDGLMNLVGELVLVKTSLLGIAERLRAGEESSTLGLELHRESRALDRKLNELQAGILEVRMVPLAQIFDKLSRMVRKLARDLGKQVEFEVKGGEVELDKLIVEDLSDPLMHLIRNALDHAIEAPEVRRAAGKPSAGRVTLSAEQKGSHVEIAVSDDGAGMDGDRIREAAVEKGVISAEAAAQLSRRDSLNLIFLAGFSTAKEVTALSGRGVGMDVVKNNIAAMSGIIDLHTEVGRGTRFEITLPVTLAIIRALVVSAAGRTYAVPLNTVLEIITVTPAELKTIEMREVISLRGTTLPLIRLGRFFGAPAGEAAKGPLYVVVVGLAQERLGVAVDGLVGQQDIVVKPLGKALAGVRGIAGATDLGNRRTILVLDVGAIIEEVVHRESLVEALEGG
ncbi:MAG TPA: chemotaxis protein CheA [Anaeromyxobacteraceae bacterium]|nr:chemotaxis protein CheA [Anaeromyxobacteraceae bacterium]